MIQRTFFAALMCMYALSIFGAAEQFNGYLAPALLLPVPSGCLRPMGMTELPGPDAVFARMLAANREQIAQHNVDTHTAMRLPEPPPIATAADTAHVTAPAPSPTPSVPCDDIHERPTPPARAEALQETVTGNKRRRTHRATAARGSLSDSSSCDEQPPKKQAACKKKTTRKKKTAVWLKVPCTEPTCATTFTGDLPTRLAQQILSHLSSEVHNKKLQQEVHDYVQQYHIKEPDGYAIKCQKCDAIMRSRVLGILPQHYRDHLYCTKKHNPEGFEVILEHVERYKRPYA